MNIIGGMVSSVAYADSDGEMTALWIRQAELKINLGRTVNLCLTSLFFLGLLPVAEIHF